MKLWRSVVEEIVSGEIRNLRSAILVGSLQDDDGAGVVDMGAIESSRVCSSWRAARLEVCAIAVYGTMVARMRLRYFGDGDGCGRVIKFCVQLEYSWRPCSLGEVTAHGDPSRAFAV